MVARIEALEAEVAALKKKGAAKAPPRKATAKAARKKA